MNELRHAIRSITLLANLTACATAGTAGNGSRPEAAPPVASACGAPPADTREVADLVQRMATSDERGPTKMRAEVGLTGPALQAADSVRFSTDPALCGRAALVYSQALGPGTPGGGVLVTRFGQYWLIVRPDGHPRPTALLVDEAFRKRAAWGL